MDEPWINQGIPNKRVLVRGSAAMDNVLSGIPFGTKVAEGKIFARYPIAGVSTPEGKAFMEAFFTKNVVELEVFADKLRALEHKQDAFTILLRSLVNKMPHLQLAWPLYISPVEGTRLSEKIDAVTLHALASLSETPSLPPSTAELISLSILHSGVGLPTGRARFLATSLAF